MLATADLGTLADHQNARTLIRSREQQHKRAQARFGNPARLRSWPGESGTARLEFRWTQVRRFLNDLSAGLGTATPVVVQEVTHAAN
jgi:hypothetical protein